MVGPTALCTIRYSEQYYKDLYYTADLLTLAEMREELSCSIAGLTSIMKYCVQHRADGADFKN